MKRAGLIIFLLILAAPLALSGQDTQQNPIRPTITFDRVWEAYKPQNVTIIVQSTGSARYVSRNPFTPPEPGADPDYTLDFTLSSRSQQKLFREAREANYFNGDFSFKKHVVASTGKKTLTYSDPVRHFSTTYDYSDNKAIEEITNLFSGISNTIEHGRKLAYLHRFDKLGLEDELKAMEDAAESHNLAEVQIIAPTLKSIQDDTKVLNIARQRAKRLLAKAKSE
ncbi:MAG TPA: hypothetical protein VE054_15530 [Blattabacteriaceae bacterium]|jgi:hypothetical protein|nr:hypothetical protein [Blattabacteriaceae bacterium]